MRHVPTRREIVVLNVILILGSLAGLLYCVNRLCVLVTRSETPTDRVAAQVARDLKEYRALELSALAFNISQTNWTLIIVPRTNEPATAK